jgi:hypothetical protein
MEIKLFQYRTRTCKGDIIKHSTHRAKRESILKESEIEEFELKEKKKKRKVVRKRKVDSSKEKNECETKKPKIAQESVNLLNEHPWIEEIPIIFHLNTTKLDLYLKKYNIMYHTKESKKAKKIKLARWQKQQREINNPEKSNNSHHCICTEGSGEGLDSCFNVTYAKKFGIILNALT